MKNTLILLLLLAAACANPAPSGAGQLSMIEKNHQWVVVDEQNNVLHEVFIYDNGPDAPSEGLYRIVKDGKIGYADAKTHAVVIEPQYDCAYPFEQGKAKVSTNCQAVQDGDHSVWESEDWEYIDKKGNK